MELIDRFGLYGRTITTKIEEPCIKKNYRNINLQNVRVFPSGKKVVNLHGANRFQFKACTYRNNS